MAGAALLAGDAIGAVGARDTVSLGFIGMGGRGLQLARAFSSISGVRIASVCDADKDRAASAAKEFGVDSWHVGYEELLDDPSIDAVVIATCNHWHCLSAIHACEAGKHVYVEKPLGHDVWQQQQLVAAARRYDRLVQVGTQQRSDPVQPLARDLLHGKKTLGKIQGVIACRLGTRYSIGRRKAPLDPSASIDQDRWFGPSTPVALYRDRLHYDWHWDWATGDGEMGNWGVHILDDVRHVALDDAVGVPSSVASLGARARWNDAGNTPNVFVSLFETSSVPVACVTNNIAPPKGSEPLRLGGVTDGYVVYCEGGRYEGRRGGGALYDADGALIQEIHGDGGASHYKNFIDAVRSGNRSRLNAEVEVGHLSSSWCHFGNASYLNGGPTSGEAIDGLSRDVPVWRDALGLIDGWMDQLGVDVAAEPFLVSDWTGIDPQTLRLAGPTTEAASRVLRGQYRSKYDIPEVIAS